MPDIEPKQAACFLTAVQAGSVRAAAEQMGLEPSTVSRNIAALEKVMATTLIERGRHGVRSTDAGTLLLSYLKRREGEFDLLRSEFDALANMKRGKVVIAVGEGFVGDLFDSALASFSDEKLNNERSQERKKMVSTGDRSAKIRTYNYPQGRITDHRINLTLYKLEEVLNGNLLEIINKLKIEDQKIQLSEHGE